MHGLLVGTATMVKHLAPAPRMVSPSLTGNP